MGNAIKKSAHYVRLVFAFICLLKQVFNGLLFILRSDHSLGLTSLIPEWGTYTSQNLLRFAHTGFSSDPQLQAMLGCSSIKKPCSSCKVLWCAEREGFEPSVPVRGQRFSRPPRSTTPASLRHMIRMWSDPQRYYPGRLSEININILCLCFLNASIV